MIIISASENRDYEGGISVGEIEGISQELSALLSEVRKDCPKPILFAYKEQVKQFEKMVCAVGDYGKEIIVYLKRDYPSQSFIEYGIAHELMHIHLKYHYKIPVLTIQAPNPELGHIIRFVENIIQDFWVDRELEKRKFNGYEEFKKNLNDTVQHLENNKLEHTSLFDELHSMAIYIQSYAFKPNYLRGIRATDKMKRNYGELKRLYRQKLPKITSDAEVIIQIIGKYNIFSNEEYIKCVNEVFDYFLPKFGFVKDEIASQRETIKLSE